MNDDFADKLSSLKTTHNELMVEYVNIINQVSKLPFLVIGDSSSFERGNTMYSYPFFRFIIRIFVESHIKSKLDEISDSYVQLSQIIKPDDPLATEYKNWLMQAKEGTDNFANTLTSLNSIRSIIAIVLPWISGLIIALLGVSDIYQAIVQGISNISISNISVPQPETNFYGIILIDKFQLIIGMILYFPLLVAMGFLYKRRLFYSNSISFWIRSHLSERSYVHNKDGRNIYEIENRLFNILDKQKALELPWDSIIFSMTIIFIIIDTIYFYPNLSYLNNIPLIIMAIVSIISGFRRFWR
jgi:hypothetical protein